MRKPKKKKVDDLPNLEIGRLVREYREQQNLSLRAFADEAGVNHTTVLRLEEGKDIFASVLVKLAKKWGFRIPALEKKVGVAK